MYLATLTSSNSSPKAVAKEPQSSTPSVVAVTFSPTEDITFAFIKLSAEIKKMIENSNLDTLQEACIEKASSPESFMSTELVPKIKATQTFRALCSMLADTTYWNFLDTRMMEAMVTASMIPAAQQTIENFKKAFFNMKLSEVVPYYVPVIPLKFGYTKVEEVINKDPKEFTISELHSHRFYLETELFKTGNGTLRYYKIMVGSVIIVWQIHVDDVYQAYISLKTQLSLPTIIHLTIPSVQRWMNIPILWRGQNIERIGPIEPLLDDLHNPLELPKQYQWTPLDSSNFVEILQFNKNYLQSVDMSCMKWIILHPYFKKQFFFGIRKFNDKKLILWIYLQFLHIVINGKPCLFLFSRNIENNADLEPNVNPSFQNIVHREIIRTAYLNKIYQIMIMTQFPEIIKPICTLSTWFSEPFLPGTGSLKTDGLRKMVAEDIPSALALTNQYTSQFEIRQIFQSEEEFSHHFFNLSLPDHIITYVVEDPSTGNITDMFSFRMINRTVENVKVAAGVNAIVVTKTPPRQLIADILVCAQKEGAEMVVTCQFGLSKMYFDELFTKSKLSIYIHFLNCNYPEIDEENCCLLSHII